MKKFFDFLNSANLILDYIAALAVCIIFALYCSGRVGYFLLIVLIMAPAVSLIYAFILSRVTAIETVSNMAEYQKGAGIFLKLYIKGGWFFMPLIEVWPAAAGGIDSAAEVMNIAPRLWGRRDENIKFTSLYSGAGYLGIKKCYIWDFLRIRKFEVLRTDKSLRLVGVIPEYLETPEAREKLTMILQEYSDMNEYDDSPFEKSGSFNGFPGYEHREYIPGDPVKRINYKLSARRDELYVRLSELQINGRIVVEADQFMPAHIEPENRSSYFQNQLEEALALTNMLLKNQYIVEFRYIANSEHVLEGESALAGDMPNERESYELMDLTGMEVLVRRLAFCRYYRQEADQ